jgi:ATP-dependent Clp protease ATP-binding subunit ClpA
VPINYPIQQIIESARAESFRMGSGYLGIEHLLYAEIRLTQSVLISTLRELDGAAVLVRFEKTLGNLLPTPLSHSAEEPKVNNPLKALLETVGNGTEHDFLETLAGSESPLWDFITGAAGIQNDKFMSLLRKDTLFMDEDDFNPDVPTLNSMCRNITLLAKQDRLNPVVGREAELEKVIDVFLRVKNSNPILVGHAGTGKTAIVEGLARRIVEKKVPPLLQDKKIFEISVSSIMSNTMYVGTLQAKMEEILKELKANPDIILFIDEIHMIMGAGTTIGNQSNDIANILKPALGRNEIRVIGATTLREYKIHIEKDAAISRRFNRVDIEEPTEENAVTIVSAWADKVLTTHFGVEITDAAVRDAVSLAKEFLPLKKLPDSAINVLDETCAHFYGRGEEKIDAAHVRTIVAGITGIDFIAKSGNLNERLEGLEQKLSDNLIGQSVAIDVVMDNIYRGYGRVEAQEKPFGVFMFFGPSGVGKTYCARLIARYLFGSENKFLRINMSEYTHPEDISQLRGARRGYVAHEEGGVLSQFIKNNPYSVVLLDEIEKAHPAVWQFFLNLFDSDPHILDTLTDEKIPAKNIIFICTTNVQPRQGGTIGFSPVETEPSKDRLVQYVHAEREGIESALLDFGFSPELLNRIQNFVPFRDLSAESLKKIVVLRLRSIQSFMEKEHGIHLEWTEDVPLLFAESSLIGGMGARPVDRLIDDLLLVTLGKAIVEETVSVNGMVRLSAGDEELIEFEYV